MAQSHVDIWEQFLDTIKGCINDQAYITWFKPIVPLNFDGAKLTLQVPSQFFYEFLEAHYQPLIQKTISQILGNGASVIFSIAGYNTEHFTVNSNKEKNLTSTNHVEDEIDLNIESTLNDRYTFERFVEGSNNQFARAASMSVAESPGTTTFNPLLIYGGVGLGKTHLIQAIGNHIQKKINMRCVLYVSSETFTFDFIDSIQNNKTTEFSNTYRNVDVLIVDDIHFFTNKERTQEEFFHTFNSLHQKGKQIVLTSDRPPKELKGIEERLISRFQWGLVADIQPPDLETRIAILQKKAEDNSLTVSKEIIQLFATNIKSNIRELEGALIRLLAASSLQGKDVTIELAKSVLKDLSLGSKKDLSIESIQRIVCEHFEIPEDLIRAKNRKKEIALARQISMFLAKKLTNHSYKTIGLHFGGRDHSTVIHAIQSIEKSKNNDQKLVESIKILERKIDIENI